jgi:predicted RNase H-like nuclease (RuvC/YqgF family)
VECDRAIRESKTKQKQLDKFHQLQANERTTFEQTLKDVSEKLNTAVVSKEEEIGRRNEVQEINKDYRNTIDKLRHTLDTHKQAHTQSEQTHAQEVSTLKSSVRDMQRELTEKQRVIVRLQKELDESKENLLQQVGSIERKYLEENTILRSVDNSFAHMWMLWIVDCAMCARFCAFLHVCSCAFILIHSNV